VIGSKALGQSVTSAPGGGAIMMWRRLLRYVVVIALICSWTLAVSETRAQSGPSRVIGPDFDGDGFADLAIGAPFADVNHRNAGAVHIIYGSGSGLTAKRRQVWSQGSQGIQDKPEFGDQFGWSIGTGDFDGDGYTDLAIGARFGPRL
jgi:hypothetical protein